MPEFEVTLMDKTNYALILIVGIVAVVGIVAMIVATSSSNTEVSPSITGNIINIPKTTTPTMAQVQCTDGNDDTTDGCVNYMNARCGDGYLYAGVEQCETTTLQGQSCQSFGYAGGALRCTQDCVFDTSECYN